MGRGDGSGGNASDASGGNVNHGELQMKLRLIACRSPPAVAARFLTGRGPVAVRGLGTPALVYF